MVYPFSQFPQEDPPGAMASGDQSPEETVLVERVQETSIEAAKLFQGQCSGESDDLVEDRVAVGHPFVDL